MSGVNRALAAGVTALLAAGLLAGCSAGAPTGSGPSNGGQSNGAASGDPTPQASAGSNSGSGDGSDPTTYTIPATFPKDVPVIEGDVVFSADLGTGWLLWLAHDDFNAGYDDAVARLKDAGFTGDTAAQAAQGSVGSFTNDKYTVVVTSGNDQTYGKAVSYTVSLN